MQNDDEMFSTIFGDGQIDPSVLNGLGGAVIMIGSDMSSGNPFAKLGTSVITGDEVEVHDGHKISLPKGMTYGRARTILDRLERDAETETQFDRAFKYRPNDGAHAAYQVLRQRYGMVLGESIQSFFGTRPPETRTVAVSANETMQLPWGLISIPSLDGVEIYMCDAHHDPEYGAVFELHVTAPKKYKDEIEALFEDIEQYLKTKSIYRGKAVSGTNSMEFLDLSGFDPEQIVFSDEVEQILNGTVWSVLRYTDSLREAKLPLKKTALLHGPYGTGKTSIGLMTALIAVENGWTFISARPGRDKVEDVLRTARLYQPAVVFVEDIDGEASSGDDDEVTRLLEAFDGITSKGGELVVVMTTNHLQRIHKGMLRPGRLDAVVEINSLDRNGVERLIKAVIPSHKLDEDVDYDAVFGAMDGFFPAFVREALDRAATFAITRLEGKLDYILTTEDLVAAAKSLHPQLKALDEAEEGSKPPALEEALGAVVRDGMSGTKLLDRYGDPCMTLSANGSSS